MPAYNYFDVTEIGDVTVVRFPRITVNMDIQDFGSELLSLVDNAGHNPFEPPMTDVLVQAIADMVKQLQAKA